MKNLVLHLKIQLAVIIGITLAIIGWAGTSGTDVSMARSIFMLQICCLVIIGILNLFWLVQPIRRIRSHLASINEGHLRVELTVNPIDELGLIASYINAIRLTLQNITGEIVGTSEAINTLMRNLEGTTDNMSNSISQAKNKTNTIATTSKDITSNMNTVAAAAEQASANVSSISNTIEKFSMNMNTVAAAAEEASTNMSDISGNVSNISKEINGITASIESMSEALNNINKNTADVMQYSEETSSGVNETLDSMNELAEVTQEISKILKLVNDIASQTNMLALNATIEAASAGEAGKGFAVVAGEIKELAKQTTDANAEIAQQIQQVQENVSVSQNHVQKISEVFTQVLGLNQGIASLVEEQTNHSVQLVDAIDSVANAAKNSALNIEEAASGIKEITRSTAEAFKGSKETAKNVSETSIGVKEIAQSSVRSAQIIKDINTNIQSINGEINDVSLAINQNSDRVAFFSDMTSSLEKSANYFTANSNVFFFWTDKLLVDHSEIDTQHKNLVSIINGVYDQIIQNKGKQAIVEQMGHLLAAAKAHFEDEQAVFEKTEYPEASSHIDIHKEIIGMLENHIEEYVNSNTENSQETLRFLKAWLLNHIMTVDKGYSSYL